MSLQAVSIVYFVGFLAVLLYVAIWSGKKNKTGHQDKATEHFLGGKTTPMFVLAMSYAASAVSAGSFIGDPGVTSVVGWPYYWFTLSLIPGLVIPGFFIIRKLRLQSEKYGCMTITEYISVRYHSNFLRWFISVVMTICLSLVLVSQFKGAASLLNRFTGIPFKIGLLVIAAVVIFYTNTGGLRSVAWTDMIQGCLMVVMVIILICTGLSQVGWLSGLEMHLAETHPEMLQIFEAPSRDAQVDVFGMIGLLLHPFFVMNGLPYVTSRYLALPDVNRRTIGRFSLISLITGTLFNAMNILGLTGRVLMPDGDPDLMTISIASDYLHPIIAGLCMIGFFAAIISTATSILLVIGQGVGRDIYAMIDRKPGSEARQIRVSQITNFAVMAVVILFNFWHTPDMLQIFIMLGMTGVASSIIFPLFCGVLWKESRKEAAIVSSIVGPAMLLFSNVVMHQSWTHQIVISIVCAFVAMIGVTWILNAIKGVDQEMVKHATVTMDDIA